MDYRVDTPTHKAKVKYNGNHYFSDEVIIGHYVKTGDGKHILYDCTPSLDVMPWYGEPRHEWVEIKEESLRPFCGKFDSYGMPLFLYDVVRVWRDNHYIIMRIDASGNTGEFEFVDADGYRREIYDTDVLDPFSYGADEAFEDWKNVCPRCGIYLGHLPENRAHDCLEALEDWLVEEFNVYGRTHMFNHMNAIYEGLKNEKEAMP